MLLRPAFGIPSGFAGGRGGAGLQRWDGYDGAECLSAHAVSAALED